MKIAVICKFVDDDHINNMLSAFAFQWTFDFLDQLINKSTKIIIQQVLMKPKYNKFENCVD